MLFLKFNRTQYVRKASLRAFAKQSRSIWIASLRSQGQRFDGRAVVN